LEGHTDNVQSVLANAHLLLQITHQDAMPLSVMEAMSVARPIMVSKIGDMPYWVKEDENGWIVNQASISLIRNKLEWAWQKRDSWEAMGRISYEMIQENFPASPEKILLNQMESVLR